MKNAAAHPIKAIAPTLPNISQAAKGISKGLKAFPGNLPFPFRTFSGRVYGSLGGRRVQSLAGLGIGFGMRDGGDPGLCFLVLE